MTKREALLKNGRNPIMLNRRALLISAALLAAVSLCVPTYAADTVDVEAAKKEGKVVWYSSTPIETAQKIADLFQKETGIKVELFRSGGSAVIRRFQTEMDAGRAMADVLTIADPAAAEVMTRKGLFVAFKPVNFDKVPEAAKDPNGNWFAQRMNTMTMYYRSDKVTEAEAPKSWTDLANPKFKGKLVMGSPSYTSSLVPVMGTMAKTLGWDFFEKLRANDVLVVQGNQQVVDNIKRGERSIAVITADSYAIEAREDGHPITIANPSDGVFIIPAPTAVIKGGPNPNAAKLFAQFQLSDAVQNLIPQEGNYAGRTDIAPPKGSAPVTSLTIIPVDYDYIEKQTAQIKKRFNEIFQ
jgi:iron(III) transport system substrate-binding protein